MFAIFESEAPYKERPLSHNVLYVEDAAVDDAIEREAAAETIDRLRRQGFDVIIAGVPIRPEFEPSMQETGGIAAGDVFLEQDAVLQNGLIVCGTLTVPEGVTLAVHGKLVAEGLRLGGRLVLHEEAYICGHSEIFGEKARLEARGHMFSTTAQVRGKACLSGSITFDTWTVNRDGEVRLQEADFLWTFGRLEEHVTLHMSGSQVRVVQYEHLAQDQVTGPGRTRVARDVRLIGDKTESRFQTGEITGEKRFAQVSGNIIIETHTS